MFKFKMSLLVQNTKFRVAVIVLLIAAIISGIVFIPRNKAGDAKQGAQLSSTQVVAEACKLLGTKYTFGAKGAAGVYDTPSQPYTENQVKNTGIDCSGLIYWTLTRLGVSTSGFSFQNPVPVDTDHWYYIDRDETIKVTKQSANLKFTYKGNTQSVKVLKADESVAQRPYYMCEDGTEIPSGSIVISYGKKYGAQDHSWIYLGNFKNVNELKDWLINDVKVPAANLEHTIYDDGKEGGTHWRIESAGGVGVRISNVDPRTDGQADGAGKAVGPIYAFKLAEQPVITGKYNVELYKVDEKGNLITSPAKFEVNGKEATTENGKIVVASNVVVTDDTTVGKYTIKETQAPENYKLFDGTISLDVKLSKVNGKLALTKDGVTFNVSGENKKATFTLDGSTIKICVPNTHKIFDLSLRNYITEIDGVAVNPSREPVINEQSIKVLQETGTAAYYHIKDSIGVTVGSEVELTIRVYNEGEILGFAKQITDYLPEGLSFVRISDKSKNEYTTTSAVGSKEIVLNYNGNKNINSLRDFFGKSEVNVTNDYYQEVKVICKVEKSNAQYITSRSEITNYGYTENGVWKEAKEIGNVDIDSVQKTIYNALNLDTWYENAKSTTYVDKNGKTLVYYPGTQDDDDFETVELLSGKYNIIIKKVDAADGKTTLAGAYFSVNGGTEVGPTAQNGEIALFVKGVEIKNDKQVDNYTIKETKAPAEYNLYNGDIKVKVATKFSGKSFVIDTEKTTVDGKDIKFTVNKENTTLTVIVPDTKKEFDLSLRKFITGVNGKALTESREPKVDVSKLAKGESTTATYTHPKNPVDVNTTDVVTYTIRVYNEGELDGYAAEIMDDIPEGLVFLPENNINKEYKWVMYKQVAQKSDKSVVFDGKNYEVTTNANEAKIIVTKYLSLENNKDNLLKAFNGKELNYKDVKAAFKVVEPTTSDRILINHAQITDDTDSNGKSVTDRDSTPNEWIENEDDQDIEAVRVRFFDLALRKWVTKTIVYENGEEKVTETNHGPWDDPEPVVKVDLKNTSIDDVVVKFEYSIRIYNQGEIAGYAKEVSDYIPEGLRFDAKDNPQWKEVDGKVVTNALENTLLKPGEYADVKITLTWINGANNLGLKTNVAEISKDYNEWGTPDIDSTPNNKVPGEDDIDDAPVILTIRTGEPIAYTGVVVAALAIISLGAVVIKKKILE